MSEIIEKNLRATIQYNEVRVCRVYVEFSRSPVQTLIQRLVYPQLWHYKLGLWLSPWTQSLDILQIGKHLDQIEQRYIGPKNGEECEFRRTPHI